MPDFGRGYRLQIRSPVHQIMSGLYLTLRAVFVYGKLNTCQAAQYSAAANSGEVWGSKDPVSIFNFIQQAWPCIAFTEATQEGQRFRGCRADCCEVCVLGLFYSGQLERQFS